MAWRALAASLVALAGLVMGAAAPSFAQETTDRALFRYDGVEYLESDLPPALRLAIYRLEAKVFADKRRLFDAALLQRYLEEEARAQETLPHILEQELFPPTEPTEAQIKQFYEANRHRTRAPLEALRPQIVEILSDRSVRQHKLEFIAGLKVVGEFEVLLEPPVAPQFELLTEGRPSKGDPEAPVTIVEFSDFQCQECGRTWPVLQAAVERSSGNVRWVHMDYPDNPSGISRTVALGGVCAGEQDAFWRYHELAFERQRGLSENSPFEFAEALGLDHARFRECFDSDEAKIMLGLTKAEGDRIGVGSVPTIFVNGREVLGGDLEADLAAAIEAALAESSIPKTM